MFVLLMRQQARATPNPESLCWHSFVLWRLLAISDWYCTDVCLKKRFDIWRSKLIQVPIKNQTRGLISLLYLLYMPRPTVRQLRLAFRLENASLTLSKDKTICLPASVKLSESRHFGWSQQQKLSVLKYQGCQVWVLGWSEITAAQ